jgi:SH3 domain-containing protein
MTVRRSVVLSLVVLCVLGLALVRPVPSQAASGVNVTFSLGCDGFTSSDGEMTLDRDNTGDGREAFILSVTDGIGNTIFAPATDSFLVGGKVFWQDGTFYAWSSVPTYNPLTLSIVSQSGNGFEQQTVFQTTGSCSTLPSLNFTNNNVFVILPANGATSPIVPINGIPPRPRNPPGLAEGQSGYAIVNTDNLYLRSGAGPTYAPVAILDGGTRLVVLGRNTAGLADDSPELWWYVQVGGMRGWVKSQFLYLRGDLTAVPEVPSLGPDTQPTMFVSVDNLPIFVTDDQFSDVACTIPGNYDYLIVGRSGDSTWYQLETVCGRQTVFGWIQASAGLIRNPAGVDIPVTTR